MNCSELPKKLGDYTEEKHREDMNNVFYELYDYHYTVYCDNDMCEKVMHKDDSIEATIKLTDYINLHFCDENCKSYGLWSIRYDYRKYYNKKNINN